MRSLAACFLMAWSMPLLAQPGPPAGVRPAKTTQALAYAESAIKQAMEQLGADKKAFDRDLEVLQHLRAAEQAMNDSMQPHNAIEKAHEEIGAAKLLARDFAVTQGIMSAERAVEGARLSPASADFGRLRGLIRSEAIGPAVRLVGRNALRLQDETLGWIRIQDLINSHVRVLTEISAESVRATQQ